MPVAEAVVPPAGAAETATAETASAETASDVRPLADWARAELRAWALLAVGALALAGVFALFLAISRIPGIEPLFPWPVGFFHKGLVIHVVFSFIVWFLAVFGALLVLATAEAARAADAGSGAGSGANSGRPRLAGAGPTAIAAVGLSAPLLFVPALLDRGEATLNNYVPTIIDPLYYAGLVVLAAGVALAALRLLVNLRRGDADASGRRWLVTSMAVAAVIYLIALACFAIALMLLAGQPPSYRFNEELFWGGGHVLQILNTQLLIVAWTMLAATALHRGPGGGAGDGRLRWAAAALLLLAAAVAPVFYLVFPPFAAEQTEAFTALQWTLGPAVLMVAIGLAAGWRERRPWQAPEVKCLALSALVFAVGGAFGMFVDGADTRTPAHYHGVIAAVTLAFMGVFYTVVLPALDRGVAPGKRVAVQIYCFAFGQLAACIGLFLAGGFGAPRKTAGDAQGLQEWGAIVGMGLNGLGGLVAVIGGILFIWMMLVALLGGARPRAGTVDAGAWSSLGPVRPGIGPVRPGRPGIAPVTPGRLQQR